MRLRCSKTTYFYESAQEKCFHLCGLTAPTHLPLTPNRNLKSNADFTFQSKSFKSTWLSRTCKSLAPFCQTLIPSSIPNPPSQTPHPSHFPFNLCNFVQESTWHKIFLKCANSFIALVLYFFCLTMEKHNWDATSLRIMDPESFAFPNGYFVNVRNPRLW